MKTPRPKFYVIRKDFTGEVEQYDVLNNLFNEILTQKGAINKKNFVVFDKDYNKVPVTTREQCKTYVNGHFRYNYWAKCECEFIIIDWPYRDTIEESHPKKIDIYDQIKPNLDLIVDLVWNYISDKIKNL